MMSQAYDYNGVVVAPSAPKKVLRTVKKTIHIDSADRDTSRYHTNGDWIAFLPRTYKNVTKIHLKSAEFPPVVAYPNVVTTITSTATSSGIATFTVGSTAGISAGSTVVLTSAGSYNGTYVVQSVPSSTTFTVRTATTGAQTSGTVTLTNPGAVSHPYSNGANVPGATYSNDTPITSSTYYFVVELGGLNKTDETVVAGNKSTLTDSFFAKIPAMTQTYGPTSFIEYNENANHDTTATFSPPIENLDRLQITTRLHSQQDHSGFIYWTSDGAVASSGTLGGPANYNLTLEIEYLDNAFDEFSSFETRIRQ